MICAWIVLGAACYRSHGHYHQLRRSGRPNKTSVEMRYLGSWAQTKPGVWLLVSQGRQGSQAADPLNSHLRPGQIRVGLCRSVPLWLEDARTSKYRHVCFIECFTGTSLVLYICVCFFLRKHHHHALRQGVPAPGEGPRHAVFGFWLECWDVNN